jgi:hypothetical protein
LPLVSAPARDPVREQVVALRQRNLSVYDIQRELAAGRHPIGINALTILLGEEGFARLPRRRDEERPAALKADSAGVADVRRLDPRLRVRSGCRRARFAPPSPACTFRTPRVFDEYAALRGYEGLLRQLTVIELGREEPTVLPTNHLKLARSPSGSSTWMHCPLCVILPLNRPSVRSMQYRGNRGQANASA